MKTPIKHALFTSGTAVVLAGGEPAGVLAALLGSALPALAESLLKKRIWLSHELLFWLVPVSLLWMCEDSLSPLIISSRAVAVAMLFAAGPLFHLLADLFTHEGVQVAGWRVSLDGGPVVEYGHLFLYLAILVGYKFFVAGQIDLASYVSFGLLPSTTAMLVVGAALFFSFAVVSFTVRLLGQGNEGGVGGFTVGKTVHITDVLRHQIEEQEANAESSQPTENTPSPMLAAVGFNDVILDKAWKEYVEPYADEIKRSGLYEVIREVFALFARIGHGVPSVFGQCFQDKMTHGLKDDFRLLSGVSLIDHTMRVVGLCLTKLQEKRGSYWVFHWPDLLLAALAHDIAKAPLVMESGYKSDRHSINSANYVGSLIRELAVEGKTERNEIILTIIRDHHNTDEKYLKFLGRILVKCDQEAREIEKDAARKGTLPAQPQGSLAVPPSFGPTPVAPAPLPATAPVSGMTQVPPRMVPAATAPLLVEEVGEITRTVQIRRGGVPVQITARTIPLDFVQQTLDLFLNTYLNVVIGGKGFWGVSQESGLVYCWTDRIYECIQAVANDRRLSSPWYFDEEHRDSLLLSFYDVLRGQEWADDAIGDKYYSNVYHFWHPAKQSEPEVARQYSTGHYMVIKAAAFGGDWEEIEAKRQINPILRLITMKPGKYTAGEGA